MDKIPLIGETEDEKVLSVKELKDVCFTWALQHLRGKYFLNKSINKAIMVSRDGLGEWKTVTKSRDQAISIKTLGELLENATLWKEELPKNQDPNIEKVIYFRQDCKANNNMYTVIITVKVYVSQNYHKYYHHYLDDFTLDPQN
jgi:hypothetical protein